MIRLFKIVFLLIVLVVFVVVGTAVYRFNTFSPRAVNATPGPKDLAYFQTSWEACRAAFISGAKALGNRYPETKVGFLKLPGKNTPDLTIDFCHVPARKKTRRLLILTSGVHGVEGFVGSAVQQMFMAELMDSLKLEEMGVLLIHGINPYGFKHRRRVTENNIDLNRNCATDKRLYESVNKGYARLNTFLNPAGQVDLGSLENLFFIARAGRQLATRGMAVLRQAILQGQYRFETGIYYGGRGPDIPIKAVTPLIRETAGPYDAVLCIDLHTGYGERGRMHLFPSPMEDGPLKQQILDIFSGHDIDWGDHEDFYTVTGDFTTYVGAVMPEKHYLPMAFEFGTLDSQTTFGAIKSLQNVILENQGVHHGYASQKDEAETGARFLEGYYPSSEAWRAKAVQDARQALSRAVPRYESLPL